MMKFPSQMQKSSNSWAETNQIFSQFLPIQMLHQPVMQFPSQGPDRRFPRVPPDFEGLQNPETETRKPRWSSYKTTFTGWILIVIYIILYYIISFCILLYYIIFYCII